MLLIAVIVVRLCLNSNIAKNDLLAGYEAFEVYQIGDRIGQLIILPYPTIEFEEADELSETERGINGYGSTGK